MIWIYKKLKEGIGILGLYSKKKALQHFKGKEGFVLLDLRTGKDLNMEG